MRHFTAAAVVLALGLMACVAGADEKPSPTNKGDEKPAKDQPKLEDFLGKWSGKWDDTYLVRFTISQDPKTKQLTVLYRFEHTLGKPLRRQWLTAKLEGNTLRVGRIIDLTLSPNDPDKGKAVGTFPTVRRTADLVREK